jgi:hypothetical protein
MSIDRDDSETTETIQAEDIEAFTDKARLRSLFNARDKASEAIRDASLNRLKAQERGASKQLAQKIVNQRIAACVRAYVSECEPLLRNTDIGKQLLYESEIESFTVPYQYQGKDFTQVLDVPAGEVDGRQITLHGLDQYLRFDAATVQYGETTVEQTPAGFEHQSPVTKTVPMPVRMSETIFRELNDLLAQLDIGLQAETESDDVASYDYSDLI